MASVSLAGMSCRRADCASPSALSIEKQTRKRESDFVAHASLRCNFLASFIEDFSANGRREFADGAQHVRA
jgi:hypothetical protein